MTTRSLVVVGAGGHGREVVEAVLAGGGTVLGVLADDADAGLLEQLGVAHLGSPAEAADLVAAGTGYVIGIGDAAIRAELAAGLDDAGLVPTTVLDPGARVGTTVRVGQGCYLAAGAVVTTNAELGLHVHLNVHAVVSHDCVVRDFATLSPGVLVNGGCRIGRRVLLGTGAVVLPGRRIGDDAVVGAGAVVLDDVAAGATVVGVPAVEVVRRRGPSSSPGSR